MLTCPHCGGAAVPDAAKCQFCANVLLLRGCPRCTARVFHGHKHCPHCGCATDAVRGTVESPRTCPRCVAALAVRMIGDVAVDECPGCIGVFIDRVAIERLLGDRQQARAESVVGVYRATPRKPDTTGRGGKLYIKCPECSTIMNRKLFARGSSVVVDVCRGHGTWFDPGELPVVVDFVMNGGLEAAEKKEIADQREAARRMQQEAYAAQLRGGGMMHHTPSRRDSGTALVDLLFSLWK
jgi:Zn-finger nucleic acid-binding protein